MTHRLVLKLLPAYLLISLLLVVSFLNIRDFQNWQDLREVNAKALSEQPIRQSNSNMCLFGKPVALSIPRFKINVEIKEGDYLQETNKWQIDSSNVFFATVSQLANNISGNTLVYGHNSDNIFGKLIDLKSQDKVYVYTNNNLIFEYYFVDSQEVLPSDVNIFKYQGEPRLTLLTCSGLLNQTRKLMRFDLLSVNSI